MPWYFGGFCSFFVKIRDIGALILYSRSIFYSNKIELQNARNKLTQYNVIVYSFPINIWSSIFRFLLQPFSVQQKLHSLESASSTDSPFCKVRHKGSSAVFSHHFLLHSSSDTQLKTQYQTIIQYVYEWELGVARYELEFKICFQYFFYFYT